MPFISDSWDRRIRRATDLAADRGPSATLLAFYARVLTCQRAIHDAVRGRPLTGTLTHDVYLLREAGAALLRDVAEHGPEMLAVEAHGLARSDRSALESILLSYWGDPSDRRFFPKAILQPYAQRLAETGVKPIGRTSVAMDNRCPSCGGAAQLSILEAGAGVTVIDGGSRQLLCATCLSRWTFGRIRCPACGEEDERKLVHFQSPEFDHVRVDACESCRHYLKSVDLGRLGLAVPLVDEVASGALDLWARDQGYQKIELNLVGL
jgi:FdhE protein